MKIENKLAIVTGASRGLGRQIALRLAKAGAKVALCARNETELKVVSKSIIDQGGFAQPYSLDISSYQQVETFVSFLHEQIGTIDILVNNAGLGWYKPFMEHSLEEIDATIDVNLKGLIYMTKAVLPDMQEKQSGQIVNIASDLGRRVIPNMAVYSGAKHGVMGFTGALLREVKNQGIKIMSIAPGIIDTSFDATHAGDKDETWSLKPEQLAEIVHTLLTQSRYLNMDEVIIHPLMQDF